MSPQVFGNRVNPGKYDMTPIVIGAPTMFPCTKLAKLRATGGVPAADACAFAPLGAMLAKVSQANVMTIQSTKFNQLRCRPHHGLTGIFKNNRNIAFHTKSDDGSRDVQGAVSKLYLVLVNSAKVR